MDSAAPVEGGQWKYDASLAQEIELRWQDRWEAEGTFVAPEPTSAELAAGRGDTFYAMDMFPYPSGRGLHVGHPLGYLATDALARFQRMRGKRVLHALGYDAFGLPAEQFAVQTGQHPRVTTEENITNMRRQLRRLGLGHDATRSFATTDPEFVKWTQWIFLQIFESWYDPQADDGRGAARPISELVASFASGERALPGDAAWADLDAAGREAVLQQHRLAYITEAPVNWCPGLGTVLANEEVTAEGRSERGNFPVFKRALKQWNLRITAYADRLADDLDTVDWPEAIKIAQRNWIGRSHGSSVRFDVAEVAEQLEVFTTRPDTLMGATFAVVAPEHPLVDRILATGVAYGAEVPEAWRGGAATPAEAVAAYRAMAAAKTDAERQDDREKTGVHTGGHVIHPVTGQALPLFIADYVMMGYGTGAVMGVPGGDERDHAFASRYGIDIIATVRAPEGHEGAWSGEGTIINSRSGDFDLDGLDVGAGKTAAIAWLESHDRGEGRTTYRLRDWLFSRQRYWGEPFPIVYDEAGTPIALPEDQLPVDLPEVDDFSPRTFPEDDVTSEPEPPLGRARDWVEVTLDLGEGPKRYWRETNTMPNWAGSSWYQLRYPDPSDDQAIIAPELERFWMGPRGEGGSGGVDLYIGGMEHAVLHLLYARFWHKVLHDLGFLSSFEPFAKLINQGYIQAYAFTDARGAYVPAEEVEERVDDAGSSTFWHEGAQVSREYGKMGKSLKNMVTPDDMYAEYGADTFRVYEMSMAPLEASRAWETRAVVGAQRFLQRLWRLIVDEDSGELLVTEDPADAATLRVLHTTIAGVTEDMEGMRFNTAIAKLIILVNHLTKQGISPREAIEPLVLMLSPFAPHVAEELWERLGHSGSVTYAPLPQADPAQLKAESVTCVVQVKGKVRDRLEVDPDIDPAELERLALAAPGAVRTLAGADIMKVIVRAPKLVNIVPAP